MQFKDVSICNIDKMVRLSFRIYSICDYLSIVKYRFLNIDSY